MCIRDRRYAIWGRLVAQQPGQIAYSIIDAKAVGRFMPPVFPGVAATTLAALADKIGLDRERFMMTLQAYNAARRPGHFAPTPSLLHNPTRRQTAQRKTRLLAQ